MASLSVVALIMSAFVGGAVAWRYASANLYRRGGSEWVTDQIDPKRINPRLLARRKRQRLQATAMTALLAPVLVFALMAGFQLLVDILDTP
jgi:hypothetical protein